MHYGGDSNVGPRTLIGCKLRSLPEEKYMYQQVVTFYYAVLYKITCSAMLPVCFFT